MKSIIMVSVWQSCSYYDPKFGVWTPSASSLTTDRSLSATVKLGEASYWIIGGLG